MKYKVIIISIVIVIIAMLSVGCNSQKLTRTTDEQRNKPNDNNNGLVSPDIRGEILKVSDDKVIRILVDSTSDSISGQIWVTINSETSFIDSEGNTIIPDEIIELFEVGKIISFLSDGMIMESYPMQTSSLNVYLD